MPNPTLKAEYNGEICEFEVVDFRRPLLGELFFTPMSEVRRAYKYQHLDNSSYHIIKKKRCRAK